jgi:1,4-alpha-glucan branching enzyme
MTETVRYDVSLLSADDLYLFNEGSHFRLYRKLGAHPLTVDGTQGRRLQRLGQRQPPPGAPGPVGPLGRFIPGVGPGMLYKYHIHSRYGDVPGGQGRRLRLLFRGPPRTASIVWDLDYAWNDQEWMASRRAITP